MKTAAIVIFIIGVFLLLYGTLSYQALTEQVVEGISGRDTNYLMWYLAGGLALTVAGGAVLILDNRK